MRWASCLKTQKHTQKRQFHRFVSLPATELLRKSDTRSAASLNKLLKPVSWESAWVLGRAEKSPSNIMSEFLRDLLPCTRGKHAHMRTHLHTPVCHRSVLGLLQTCADITIKPRTRWHRTVIHHMHHTHTHRTHLTQRASAVAGGSSRMLRGRYASHAGSSTMQLDWGVKINFQAQLGSSLHYSAPLEWIFLRDKRTICFALLRRWLCPFSPPHLFWKKMRLILSRSNTFPANTPLVSTQPCHRGADNFQGFKEDAFLGAPGTQAGRRPRDFDLIKRARPPSLVSGIVLEIALTCRVITSNEQLGGWLSQ